MSTGLRLRITNTTKKTRVERAFAHFPVRIGRNTLNDLAIPEAFVSQFHAVVELHDAELMLRDLGSSNGTKVGPNRAPPHEPVALAKSDNAFTIGPLRFEAQVGDVDASLRPPADGYANEDDDPDASVLRHSVVADKTLMFNDPGAADKLAEMRARFAKMEKGGNLSSTAVIDPTKDLPPPSVNDKQRKMEQLALQGLLEIAQVIAPGLGKIEEPEELVKFLSSVRDSLAMFFRCFIPLRDGYRQFASELQIGRGGNFSPMSSQKRVETAQTEQELAEVLLDWKTDHSDAQRAIEGTFADLMIHQLALLNAIMRGVKTLLQELSPNAVDKAFVELSKQGKTGFAWGPWRFKQLWAVFGRKHGDLDDGDKRTFAALFGPDFASAYKQYRDTVDAPHAEHGESVAMLEAGTPHE